MRVRANINVGGLAAGETGEMEETDLLDSRLKRGFVSKVDADDTSGPETTDPGELPRAAVPEPATPDTPIDGDGPDEKASRRRKTA